VSFALKAVPVSFPLRTMSRHQYLANHFPLLGPFEFGCLRAFDDSARSASVS
jgi:hypothetical protein